MRGAWRRSPRSNASEAAVGSTLETLQELGQSPWLDFITRALLRSGKLAEMVRAGHVTGLTSNPTIFDQAIAKSADYDDALATLVRAGKPAPGIVDALTIEDVRAAADVFAPVYARTKRADGYVSIEIDPTLAHDAAGTVREAKRIWRAVNRPNLLVKIPATRAGVTAIEETIASGINVNVTLIFSLARYGEVMDAYVRGLTSRLEAGTRVDRIASVASFFVSRVDSAVDRLIDERVGAVAGEARVALERLRGKAAIANAKLAYAAFREHFGDRFALLAREGARPQRPLWASTSTKNPAYPDVYYVEALIGTDTVNTLPPATLEAYLDHGHPERRLEAGLDRAREVLAQLAHAGIDLDKVTERLETEGVAAFVASYRSLVDTVTVRREAALIAQRTTEMLGPAARGTDAGVRDLDTTDAIARLWKKDATLWPVSDEAARHEIANRLGWLDVGRTMAPHVPSLVAFADDVRAAGFTHAVLCGMGGSSLAPEVLRRSLGLRRGHLDLTVLDSTDPAAVLAAAQRNDPAKTLYIVSSKSGDTIEVRAFFAFFWDRLQQTVADRAGDHVVAITDPGTGLEALARERRFRRVFLNPPDIGGRYSALSLFGLVPAALMGHDLEKLLARAQRMLVACGPGVRAARNPGARLGAVFAGAARAGRDKLTLVMADKIAPFADWAEQLVAESLGKQDTGIVPIAGEPIGPPALYGKDRVFVGMHVGSGGGRSLASLARAGHPVVTIRLADAYDLAGEFVRWEIATAIAGSLLGVNPFDQPNVQEAKTRTTRLLAEPGRRPSGTSGRALDDPDLPSDLWRILAHGGGRRYVAVTAYVAPSPRRTKLLTDLRTRIRKQFGTATTVGYGPRFLHSTGQLHKGGPATVTVLQLTGDDPVDVPVPSAGYSFGTLLAAQAEGDADALSAKGRTVLRVHLGRNVERALEQLAAVLARRPRTRSSKRRSGATRAARGPVRAHAGRRP
jgi:transaldolase / glucose-6-phosphate isomerase